MGKAFLRLQKGADANIASEATDVQWYDILIWDKGVKTNRSEANDLFFDMISDDKFGEGARGVKFNDGVATIEGVAHNFVDDFKPMFDSEGRMAGVRRLSPFNPYMRRVDHGDVKSFLGIMGRTYGIYKLAGELKDGRQMALDYNQNEQARYTYENNIFQAEMANWPAEVAARKQAAQDIWQGHLATWQSAGTGSFNDLYRISFKQQAQPPLEGWPEGGDVTEVDLIYSRIMRLISPHVSGQPTIHQNRWIWTRKPWDKLGLNPNKQSTWTDYKPPDLTMPVAPDAAQSVAVPSKTWQKLAKGYFIAEICLMGAVALMHLYDAVKGDPDATLSSSGWQVSYAPSLIQDRDGDGAYGRYFKRHLRNRDVLGNVRSILSSIFNQVGKVLSWVVKRYGDGADETCKKSNYCMRARADAYKVNSGCLIETLFYWKKALDAFTNACVTGMKHGRNRPEAGGFWYEKDLIQHYQAISYNIETNLQALAAMENLAAKHWATELDTTVVGSVDSFENYGVAYPAQFRCSVTSTGWWGYISSIEIIDPGSGAFGHSDSNPGMMVASSLDGEYLKISGLDFLEEIPEVVVTFVNGRAVAVTMQGDLEEWTDPDWSKMFNYEADANGAPVDNGDDGYNYKAGHKRHKFGKGFMCAPALVVTKKVYGNHVKASRDENGPTMNRNGWMICADKEDQRGAGISDKIPQISTIAAEEEQAWNKPQNKKGNLQVTDDSEATARQMDAKYGRIYHLALETLKSARRGIECRWITDLKEGKRGALEDVFGDGDSSAAREVTLAGAIPQDGTRFEALACMRMEFDSKIGHWRWWGCVADSADQGGRIVAKAGSHGAKTIKDPAGSLWQYANLESSSGSFPPPDYHGGLKQCTGTDNEANNQWVMTMMNPDYIGKKHGGYSSFLGVVAVNREEAEKLGGPYAWPARKAPNAGGAHTLWYAGMDIIHGNFKTGKGSSAVDKAIGPQSIWSRLTGVQKVYAGIPGTPFTVAWENATSYINDDWKSWHVAPSVGKEFFTIKGLRKQYRTYNKLRTSVAGKMHRPWCAHHDPDTPMWCGMLGTVQANACRLTAHEKKDGTVFISGPSTFDFTRASTGETTDYGIMKKRFRKGLFKFFWSGAKMGSSTANYRDRGGTYCKTQTFPAGLAFRNKVLNYKYERTEAETDFYPWCRTSNMGMFSDVGDIAPTCYELRGQLLYGKYDEWSNPNRTRQYNLSWKKAAALLKNSNLRQQFVRNTEKAIFGPVMNEAAAKGVDKIWSVGWKPGKCNETEIKNFSRKLSKHFFEDIRAYDSFSKENRYEESVCDKRSCGAIHAYTNVPSIGENEKITSCGNVEIMWNFHPDSSRAVFGEYANHPFSVWLGLNNATSLALDLLPYRNPAAPSGIWSHLETSPDGKGLFGSNSADLTLPMILGNWTIVAVPGSEGGPHGGSPDISFWKRLLRTVANIITLGQFKNLVGDGKWYAYNDPRIDRKRGLQMEGYTRDLIKDYHRYRMYKQDFKEAGHPGGASKSTMYPYGVAPSHTNDPRRTFGGQMGYAPQRDIGPREYGDNDSADSIKEHAKNIIEHYKRWAEVTGDLVAIDKPESKNVTIKPLLTQTRRYSGWCWPIIYETGLTTEPFMLGASGKLDSTYEFISAPAIGKRYQEIGFATNMAEITDEKFLVNVDYPNSHIAGAEQAFPAQSNLAVGEKKPATETEYFRETVESRGEWETIVRSVDNQIGAFASMLPQVIVRDMSFHAVNRPHSDKDCGCAPWWNIGAVGSSDDVNGAEAGEGGTLQYTAGIDMVRDGQDNAGEDTPSNPNTLMTEGTLYFACIKAHTPSINNRPHSFDSTWTNFWELCAPCGEETDGGNSRKHGVRIDESQGVKYNAMDYSGYKLHLETVSGANGGGGLIGAARLTEKDILEGLKKYKIKDDESWISDWASYQLTGEGFYDPEDAYNSSVAQSVDYNDHVNQWHFKGDHDHTWKQNTNWTDQIYSGFGYGCTISEATWDAYIALSGDYNANGNYCGGMPLPGKKWKLNWHGYGDRDTEPKVRGLNTGVIAAESGAAAHLLDPPGAEFVNTTIMMTNEPCDSTYNYSAGTGRWSPAPPCKLTGPGGEPLFWPYLLTGTGDNCTIADAALAVKVAQAEDAHVLKGCGFEWAGNRLSTDWPVLWMGTGVDTDAAINVITDGDPEADANTTARSGYLDWQDFIHNGAALGGGYYDELGLRACLPGNDKAAWRAYINALPTNAQPLVCSYHPPSTQGWVGTNSSSITMAGQLQLFPGLFAQYGYNAGALAWNELLWVSGSFKSIAYDTISDELERGEDAAGNAGQFDVSTASDVTVVTKNIAGVNHPVVMYPTKTGNNPTLTYFVDSNGDWKHPIINLKDYSTLQGGSAAQSGNATSHNVYVAEAVEYGDNGDGTWWWGGSRYFTSLDGFNPDPTDYWECVLQTDCACIQTQTGQAPKVMLDNQGEALTAKHLVTGRVSRNEWQYYLSMYRPVYSGILVASGDYPVITGTCDWSAAKSQNWKQGIYGSTHEFAGESYWWLESTPEDATEGRKIGDKYYGTYSMPEAYYVEYPTDSAVVLTGVGGLTWKQKRSRTIANLRANDPKLTPEQALAQAKLDVDGVHKTGEVHAMVVTAQGTAGGTYDLGDNSSAKIMGPDDKRGDISFVGGWPLINQEYTETNTLHVGNEYKKETPFGWKCLLLDDKQARPESDKVYRNSRLRSVGTATHYMQSTINRAAGTTTAATVGALLSPHAKPLELQTQVFDNRHQFDAMVGSATRLQNLAQHHSYLLNISNQGVLTDQGPSVSAKLKSRNILLFVYQNSATACDTCIGHGVVPGAAGAAGGGAAGVANVAVGDEVMFFNENQKMGMGVTWELRSGDWNFKVPYATENTLVSDPRGGGGTLRIRPWFKMVQEQWTTNDYYTGQQSFWSLPGSDDGLYNFEIGCNIENAQSKLDKVIDWHNIFSNSASYEEMTKRASDPNDPSRQYSTEK